MIDECGAVSGMRIGRRNRNTLRKPTSTATMSTTNPTYLDQGSNRVYRDGNPATNPLIYGTADAII
jgi:hypothetical protein